MADDGVQAIQNLAGILCQQAFGVLIENLKGVFVLPGLHESVGKAGDCCEIVVDRQELVCDGSSFGELSGQ